MSNQSLTTSLLLNSPARELTLLLFPTILFSSLYCRHVILIYHTVIFYKRSPGCHDSDHCCVTTLTLQISQNCFTCDFAQTEVCLVLSTAQSLNKYNQPQWTFLRFAITPFKRSRLYCGVQLLDCRLSWTPTPLLSPTLWIISYVFSFGLCIRLSQRDPVFFILSVSLRCRKGLFKAIKGREYFTLKWLYGSTHLHTAVVVNIV